jgi:hypothetical protein
MTLFRLPCLALIVLVPVAVAAVSCGGASPSSPLPPSTTVPLPSPTPSPTPAGTNSCPLGRGDVEAECGRSGSQLMSVVETALDALVRDRPELFNTNEESVANTGQYRVLDAEAYLEGLISRLRAGGLCAERLLLNPENIVIKDSNDFSEEWDVLTSSGFIRRGAYAYQTTCRPAVFPIEPRDLIAYVRTHLWGYECPPGFTPPTPGERKLPIVCDGRATATPKLSNGRDVPASVHGPDVLWDLREGQDIVTLGIDPRFPDNPFDKLLMPSGRIGNFKLCATVLGKEGCLDAQTIP